MLWNHQVRPHALCVCYLTLCSTPLWRDAGDHKVLCNACGIRYKKYGLLCPSCHVCTLADQSVSHRPAVCAVQAGEGVQNMPPLHDTAALATQEEQIVLRLLSATPFALLLNHEVFRRVCLWSWMH